MPPRRGSAVGGVTIYDVAEVAGVSASTVSRTFSRPGRVNSRTAEAIRQVAEELGYRTNPVARALSTARHRSIAILVTDLINPFCAELTRGVQDVTYAADYTLQLIDTRESGRRERQAISRTLGVDGIILQSPRMNDASIRVAARERPLVLVNRVLKGLPSVVVDLPLGARLAVDHLVALGHTNLVYVAGPANSWVDSVRWRALYDYAAGLGVRVHRLGPYSQSVEGGEAATDEVLAHHHPGVVIYNDLMALGLIRGIRRRGGAVPDDACVVGYDNITAGAFASPSLTTVAAPLHEMGRVAARLMLDIVEGHETTTEPVVLPATLVKRESTAPIGG